MFQIFAQLIELHPKELPAFYMSSLFQPLLAPMFWERAGNVPALSRLMQVQMLSLGVVQPSGFATGFKGMLQSSGSRVQYSKHVS